MSDQQKFVIECRYRIGKASMGYMAPAAGNQLRTVPNVRDAYSCSFTSANDIARRIEREYRHIECVVAERLMKAD